MQWRSFRPLSLLPCLRGSSAHIPWCAQRKLQEAMHRASNFWRRCCNIWDVTAMSDTAEFEGGCLCGAVRYRAISSPIRGVICHCSMCRKHSGAPYWPSFTFGLKTSLGFAVNQLATGLRHLRSAASARRAEARSACTKQCLLIVFRSPSAPWTNRSVYASMTMSGRNINSPGFRSTINCHAFPQAALRCLPRRVAVRARPDLPVSGSDTARLAVAPVRVS